MNAQKEDDAPKGIILSPKDMRQAVHLLELLTSDRSRRNEASREDLIGIASFSLTMRQGRADHFPPAMFGEPAWDMLLALYVSQADNPAPAVSNLAKSARIAITTAFRWIDYLEKKGFIERRRSSDDGRALTVALSNDVRIRLDVYFADLLAGMTALREEIAAGNRADISLP